MQTSEQLEIKPFEFDQDLLDSVKTTGKPGMKVYSFPETAVVLGRGSNPEEELEVDNCLQEGLTIYKRPGGGCSVLLDPGNLVVSTAFPVEGLKDTKLWFNRCTSWLVDGLKTVGIGDVYDDGISDLVIDNKKIAGSAFYRMKGFAYYTASLMVNPDIEKMQKMLKHPPREPDYREGRIHKEFVISLSQVSKYNSAPQLLASLLEVLKIEDLVN